MRSFTLLAAPLLACLFQSTALSADPVPIELAGDSAALKIWLKETESFAPMKIVEEGQGALVLSSSLGPVADDQTKWKPLPADLVEMVPTEARGPENHWVGIAANPRCLIYRPSVIEDDDLPDGLDRLDDPEWKERVGWVPSDAGFQTMIGVMSILQGDEETFQWLERMKQNGTKSFASMDEAIASLAKGEIDGVLGSVQSGFTAIAGSPEADLKTYIFAEGKAGSFIDYVTVAARSEPDAAAIAWLKAVLGTQVQSAVAAANYYPIASGVKPQEALQPLDTVMHPTIEPARLDQLSAGPSLLSKAGLLP